MTDIERAEQILSEGVIHPTTMAEAQIYATLSIAKSLEFICGYLSGSYADGNPVADAINNVAANLFRGGR